MLKRVSLRARLTLLSALVMACVAFALTAVSIFSADRIFVQSIPHDISVSLSSLDSGEHNISTFTPDVPNSSYTTYSIEPSNQNGVEITGNDASDTTNADYTILQLTLAKAGRQFNLWGIAGFALVILLGTGATWLMAGRALRPVRELSSAIEEIGGNDLSRRVDDHGRQDEIGQLAQSFNAMMDKVSNSFARQKRFSANAAHELKTPLTTIQVGLEVLDLDEHPAPSRMEKALAVVRTNTQRMIRLVDDLFRLSADEACEQRDEIPLCQLFMEIQAELSPQIQAKKLIVSAEAPPELKVTGNHTMLYRALFNLAENAVKYNHPGGSLHLSAFAEEAGCIGVQVSDSGVGIPQEELKHIFEPFYRVDQSRSRAVGGSGLGLSLVQDIIAKHGGTIQASSTPGEGTTFTLRFPCPAAACPAEC